MRFDRAKFFDGFRDRLDSTIEQEQVKGLEFLLSRIENDGFWKLIPQIAYALATTFHETAGSFQPVEEGYYLGKKAKAFQKKLRYFPFFGRGYVQLTWKSNYAKATREIRRQMPSLVAQFEAVTSQRFDLVANPEQALDPLVAYACLTLGMQQGWYGPKGLSSYINAQEVDYVEARRTVNVQDKAGLIAGYARSFEKILRASLIDPNRPATVPAAGTLEPVTESVAPVSGVNETNSAAKSPVQTEADTPSSEPVEVKKEKVDIFVKIGAAFTAITGFGINVGTLIQTKLEQMTVQQVAYLLGALGLIALAVWWYRKADKGAQNRTLELVATAADPNSNTVVMT